MVDSLRPCGASVVHGNGRLLGDLRSPTRRMVLVMVGRPVEHNLNKAKICLDFGVHFSVVCVRGKAIQTFIFAVARARGNSFGSASD